MDKVISRGYVKWTDKDGVFHKEMLVDHPDMLAKATDEQKLDAEIVEQSHKDAEAFYAERDEVAEETVIKSGGEEPAVDEEHLAPLELLKKQTA